MRKVIWACLALFLTACSSGSSSSGSGEPADVNGTWRGTIVATNVMNMATNNSSTVTARLSQVTTSEGTGTATVFTATVTGTASIPSTGLGCFTGGTIAGTVTGDVFELTISDPNGATISITANVDGNRITGTFSSAGGPCGPVSGTFNLTRV